MIDLASPILASPILNEWMIIQTGDVVCPADLLSTRSGPEVLLQLTGVCLLGLHLPLQHLTPALPLCQLSLQPLRAAG